MTKTLVAMSEDALRWAWRVDDLDPISKLLLVAIATMADKTGKASPHLHHLSKMTGQDCEEIVEYMRDLHRRRIIKMAKDHIEVSVIKGKSSKLKEIEEIYSLYPRKEGVAVAKTAIGKALSKIAFSDLLEAVQAYATAKEGEDKKFIPMPATWFNQERWKDDRDMWKAERKTAVTEPPQWKLDNLAKALGAVEQAETALRRSRRLAAGRIGWEDGRSNREEHENLARAKKEVERWT